MRSEFLLAHQPVRRLAVGRRHHVVGLERQVVHEPSLNGRIVFDDKNAAHRSALCGEAARRERQVHRECVSSTPTVDLHVDAPAVRLHDLVDERQAQAGTGNSAVFRHIRA